LEKIKIQKNARYKKNQDTKKKMSTTPSSSSSSSSQDEIRERKELFQTGQKYMSWAIVLFITVLICIVFFLLSLVIDSWPRFLYPMFLFLAVLSFIASFILYTNGRMKEKRAHYETTKQQL
jgi:bacteriorhodopsin